MNDKNEKFPVKYLNIVLENARVPGNAGGAVPHSTCYDAAPLRNAFTPYRYLPNIFYCFVLIVR